MKYTSFLTVLFLFFGRDLTHAQACASSPFFQQGKQIEFTATTAQKKVTKTKYIVKSVTHRADGLVATYDIVYDKGVDSVFKKSGNSFLSSSLCNGSGVTVFFQMKSPQLNFSIAYAYPSDMKVGNKLKDIQTTIPFKIDSKKAASQTISMLAHFTVEGKEMVTTPAGSWMCFKIKETVITEMPGYKMPNGAVAPPDTTDFYQWYSPTMGLVKMDMGFTNSILSAVN